MLIKKIFFQPQNLLLTKPFPDCEVKLCDFGISRLITKGIEIREIVGTPDYVGEYVVCRLIQLRFSSGWYLITGDASDLGLFCSETLLEEKDSLCCQKTSPDWSYSSLDLFIYKYYMIVIVSFVAGVIFSFKIFFSNAIIGSTKEGVYCLFLNCEISLKKCDIYLFYLLLFFFKKGLNFFF